MSQISYSIRVRNPSARNIDLLLEPWGEHHVLSGQQTVRIMAAGPLSANPNDVLEIEIGNDAITIYGWSGSTVTLAKEES